MRQITFCLVLFLAVGSAGLVQAADLTTAQNTVNNISQAQPPSVSSSTKPSPVGQPISDYKPSGPSLTITEPPSPVKSYNPQNDPDVQR